MKMLSKRLSKSLLVSVLALILVGSAAAAFTWISNMRTTVVTVRENLPIILTGDFVSSPLAYEPVLQLFNYTVTSPTYAVGYILVQFQAPGQTLNIGDISFSIGILGYRDVRLITGYPMVSPSDTLTILYGYSDHTSPLDFASIGLTGIIIVETLYKVAYSINASIAITSTY